MLTMLIKYFFEIRNRAILIIFSWIATVIVAYLNKETLLFLSIKPNLSLFEKTSFYFIATNITDIFSAYLSLAYLVGFQLTFIFSLYHIKTFIIPALYEAEHKKLILFTYLSISLWGFSLLLLNTVVLPFCWNFFRVSRTHQFSQSIYF